MMKKFFTLALLGVSLAVNAQQVNGSFETWENCYPWSSTTTNKKVGTQPVGWKMSNVSYNTFSSSTVGAETTDAAGGKGVLLTNQDVKGQKIPAYISLGTPWSTASTRLNTVKDGSADGGVWGGIEFTYKPDAVKLQYKRSLTDGSTERASVIAYLWKGTWTQKSVPANVAVGFIIYGSPKAVDMTDRDRNVLYNASGTVGGSISSTSDAELIASKEYYITDVASDWTSLTVDLNYKTNSTPEKLNIILSANDFFADRSGIVANNTLSVDDVKLIYRSQISSLKVNGTALEGFNKDTYTYAIKGSCPESEAAFDAVLNGKNASIAWTKSGNTYTATVSNVGEDESGVTSHTYTFEFIDLGITSIAYNGSVKSNIEAEQHYFVFNGGTLAEGSDLLTVTANNPEASVTQTLDKASRVVTVKISKSGLSETYYVKIAQETVTNYTDKMYIALAGSLIGVSTRGVDDVSAIEVSQPETPADAAVEGKVVDFQLKNFDFKGSILGDIYVTQVPYAVQSDGSIVLQKDATIIIFGDAGSKRGELPVRLNAKIENGILEGSINITWSGKPINVDLYPLNAASVDLSAYDLGEATTELISQDFTNPNCVFFLGEGAGLSGANIVCGTNCENLSLTEGNAFSVSKEFTATNVTYNRTLTAGQTATFILPFAFTPDENDVVAELSEVSGSTLVFKPVTQTVANKPYVILTNNADALKQFTNVTVKPAAEGDMKTTVAGYTHIGTYEILTGLTGYGYSGGNFVHTTSGTLKPFRTFVTAPSGESLKTLQIDIADDLTGIDEVETEQKDSAVYDLQGIRVSSNLRGLAKGVYVVNGKKVIVK